MKLILLSSSSGALIAGGMLLSVAGNIRDRGVATAFGVRSLSSSSLPSVNAHFVNTNNMNVVDTPQSDTKLVPMLDRRSILSAFTHTVSTITIINYNPQNVHADEPSNLYYKSKADEDDPLVVFGKTLENMNIDSSSSDSSNSSGGSALPKSFSDISLPSESTDASSESPPMGGGDLTKVLKEKKDSQKRSVDPRTHG